MDHIPAAKTYKHRQETVRAAENQSACASKPWMLACGNGQIKFMTDSDFKKEYEEVTESEWRKHIACQEYHALFKAEPDESPPLLDLPARCPFCKKLFD